MGSVLMTTFFFLVSTWSCWAADVEAFASEAAATAANPIDRSTCLRSGGDAAGGSTTRAAAASFLATAAASASAAFSFAAISFFSLASAAFSFAAAASF
uniref:Secreted protein n=1 Tax=Anopheles darlingi TaxID=43151 RepID=A0A2M4DF13_ANODA